jgi:hypothetical protein
MCFSSFSIALMVASFDASTLFVLLSSTSSHSALFLGLTRDSAEHCQTE